MVEHFADLRCQSRLQKYIRGNPELTDYPPLHSLKLCGTGVIPSCEPKVHVVRSVNKKNPDDVTASFIGLTRCHSAWACPHCTPIVMAKKGQEIAIALDALEARNLSAAMLTFTIPHIKRQTAAEVYTILRATWRKFANGCRTTAQRKHQLATGETRIYSINKNPFGRFLRLNKCTYSVRVYEFTWSNRNGWHPHIHALYWFPKELFSNITNYETELAEKWLYAARFETTKFYMQQKDWRFNGDEQAVHNFVNLIFAGADRSKHTGFYISKNHNGTPRQVKSANYLDDWSAPQELTAQVHKTPAQGHYNPFQMINKAVAAESWEQAKFWLELFVEYADATWATRRVQWAARTDIKQIIADWMTQHEIVSIIKKKDTTHESTTVYTFSEEQWSAICCFDNHFPDLQIKVEILERARLPDATTQIDSFIREIFSNLTIEVA